MKNMRAFQDEGRLDMKIAVKEKAPENCRGHFFEAAEAFGFLELQPQRALQYACTAGRAGDGSKRDAIRLLDVNS